MAFTKEGQMLFSLFVFVFFGFAFAKAGHRRETFEMSLLGSRRAFAVSSFWALEILSIVTFGLSQFLHFGLSRMSILGSRLPARLLLHFCEEVGFSLTSNVCEDCNQSRGTFAFLHFCEEF